MDELTVLVLGDLPKITVEDFVVTPKVISDVGKELAPLSNGVWDKYFPVYGGHDIWHFTKPEAAKNILAEGKIRFYSLHSRFKDGEFIQFVKDHNLDGYENRVTDSGGKLFAYLMSQNFFLSTSASDMSEKNECSNWDVFAAGGTGVRFHFRFDRQFKPFKRVYYRDSDGCLPLLRDLSEAASAHNRLLVLQGVSRAGCYYIRGSYRQEDEVRLLIPKQSDGWPKNLIPVLDDTYAVNGVEVIAPVEYIPVSLDQPTNFENSFGFELTLAAVEPGPGCDQKIVQGWVDAGRLSGVKVLPSYSKEKYEAYLHGLALLNAR